MASVITISIRPDDVSTPLIIEMIYFCPCGGVICMSLNSCLYGNKVSEEDVYCKSVYMAIHTNIYLEEKLTSMKNNILNSAMKYLEDKSEQHILFSKRDFNYSFLI